MLAHKVKGVDKHYSNHDIEEFLLAFRKALPWLLPHTIEQTNAQIIDEQKRIAQLENDLASMQKQYSALFARTKPLIDRIDEIADFLDKEMRKSGLKKKSNFKSTKMKSCRG